MTATFREVKERAVRGESKQNNEVRLAAQASTRLRTVCWEIKGVCSARELGAFQKASFIEKLKAVARLVLVEYRIAFWSP